MTNKNRDDIRTIDLNVSENLRRKRHSLGISQQSVANALGVSIQQVQKYETGKNRISSGKLNTIAIYFKTPFSYFFDQSYINEIVSCDNKLERKQISSLLTAFCSIKKFDIKDKIIEMVKLMS